MFRPQGNDGDAPFNMAMMFYYRLNELLAAKDRAAIGSDMNAYYSCLEAVFNNIYFKICKEDNTETIIKNLDMAINILSAALPSDRGMAVQAQKINFWDTRKLLVEIDRDLMVLMDKKKMIFPRIEVTQGLGALRDAMGLDKDVAKN